MSTPYNPAEPGAGNGPAGWDSSQPSLLSAAKDTVATSVPRGLGVVGSAKAGYAAGKMLGAERAGNQPAPTDGGWANEEANDNGDGGSDSEFATKEDIGGLHKKLDAMSAGMQNQGPVASRSEAFGQGQQGGPRATGTQRPPSILEHYKQQTAAAYSKMADSHTALMGGMANTLARFQQRQSMHAPVGSTGTGNGVSARQQEQTMGSLLPVQNAASDSTYAQTRFRGQQ